MPILILFIINIFFLFPDFSGASIDSQKESTIREIPESSLKTPAGQSYQKGLQFLVDGDLKKSESAFKESLKQDNKFVPSLLGLAELSFRRKDLNQAEKHMKEAIALAPEDPYTLASYGRLQILKGNFDEAERLLRKSINNKPDNIRTIMDMGDFYMTYRNKPQDALKLYENVLRINSKHAGAHFAAGNAFIRLGDTAKAESELNESARLEPNNPLPPNALSRLFATQNNITKAIEYVNKALAINPSFYDARIDLGDYFIIKRDMSSALSEFKKAASINPKSPEPYLKMGLVYHSEGKFDDAKKSYESALKINSNLSIAYNNLAWIAINRNNNLKEAEIMAQKAVKISPKTGQFLDTLGWVYKFKKEYSKAISTLTEAIKLDPSNPETFYHLGAVYFETGDTANAQSYLKKSLDYRRNFPNKSEAQKLLDTITLKNKSIKS